MFSKVIGLDQVCKKLTNAFLQNTLADVYLFIGCEGRGKSFVASRLAKAILCKSQTNCNNCYSCDLFKNANHPDFIVCKPKANFIQLEQIQQLQKKLYLAPTIAKCKIIFIKEAEKMNQESANAFLKSLEEPPPNNYFILTTTNEKAILPTILSRCLKILFPAFTTEEIKYQLREIFKIEDNWIIPFQKSSIKKNWFTQIEKINQLRIEIWDCLSSLSLLKIVQLANSGQKWIEEKTFLTNALIFIKAFFYDLKILSVSENEELLYCADLKNKTKQAIKFYDLEKINDLYEEITTIEKNIQLFANKNLAWDSVLIRIKKILI